MTAVAIVVVGSIVQIVVQAKLRPHAVEGIYFQSWSSETAMQTVSVADLRATPLQTLNNIHIQPPGFDALRAILARFAPDDPAAMVRGVDRGLYLIYAGLYGALGGVAFLWLRRLVPPTWALLGSIGLLLHPATVFYATLLDSTFLGAFLLTVSYYVLWEIRSGHWKLVPLYTLAFLALFFARSFIQWPTIFVFAIPLVLLRVPRRRVALFVAIAGTVIGGFVAKQHHKFDLTTTSSFVGLNLCGSVGLRPMQKYWQDAPRVTLEHQPGDDALPRVLTRSVKLTGAPNFNHIRFLVVNRQLIAEFESRFRTATPQEMLGWYATSLSLYLQPSSRYSPDHVIVDRMPWRGLYDRVFSYPLLPIVLTILTIHWLRRAKSNRELRSAIALVVPGLYVVAVSVLFDSGENMRFKFFVEPVLWVALFAETYKLLSDQFDRRIRRPWQDRRSQRMLVRASMR
jgi:hypothetical protein